MNDSSPSNATPKSPITIKKYANRRLYNTATSAYVTLENLSAMVKEGVEFNVYDAKTGEELTRSVLTQIIVEEEGKSGQQNLLPISFLRQLIGFYGNSMQWMVPKYLEHSMETLSSNQEQLRGCFKTNFNPLFPFGTTLEAMSKQNLSMFERALSLFSPFATKPGGSAEPAKTESPEKAPANDEKPAAQAEDACACGSGCACEESPSVEEKPVKEEPKAEPPVASVTRITRRAEAAEAAASAPAPVATPMPNVRSATLSPTAEDMQQKIANLQRQLADLARNRG